MKIHKKRFLRGSASGHRRFALNKKIISGVCMLALLVVGGVGLMIGNTSAAETLTWKKGSSEELMVFQPLGQLTPDYVSIDGTVLDASSCYRVIANGDGVFINSSCLQNYSVGPHSIQMKGSNVWSFVLVVEADYTLSFDANGGSGVPSAATCTASTNSNTCSVTVSGPAPTRSGFVFLGYADASSATSATRAIGSSVSMSANKTIYAIWAPIYKLTADANGGAFESGEALSNTCNPSTTNGTCEITLPTEKPVREGYVLLGYANTDSAKIPQYTIDDKITMDATKTVYAVWVNTDVESWMDGNGNFVIKTDIPLSYIKEVLIDDEVIDKSNYVIDADNGTVTLNSNFLNTLTVGKHVMTVRLADGQDLKIEFTVTESGNAEASDMTSGSSSGISVPNTGEQKSGEMNANSSLYILPVAVIAVAVVGGYVYKTKKAHRKFDR